MTTVNSILNFIESLAPAYMKENWDNVGLLCGSGSKEVKKVLIALDPFSHVCEEAVQWGADLVLTHHPLIFSPLKALTDDTEVGKCLMTLVRNDIAAINAHTNLDKCPMGVNHVLATALGLENIELITPEGADCEGRSFGLLRMGDVTKQSLPDFLRHVKQQLGTPVLRYADGGKPVRKVAVGGGACGAGFEEAVLAGCDTFVTADVKYNQFWDAKAAGLTIIDAGHFYTENPVCAMLETRIREYFPEVEVKISETHRDCMKFY